MNGPWIDSILPSGYGHWKVTVKQYNFGRKTHHITSTSIWKYTTNDSVLVDEVKYENIKRADKDLIRKVKLNGYKIIEK